MRTIERSTAFKKDYKRVKKQPQHSKDLDENLVSVLNELIADRQLPPTLLDHSLRGDWVNYRECHIKPDLLLIYKNEGDTVLRLARLGSHSDLFK